MSRGKLEPAHRGVTEWASDRPAVENGSVDYRVASGRDHHGNGFILARLKPANRVATQVPAIFMRSINTEPIVLLPIV